jgi:hypothetical protein
LASNAGNQIQFVQLRIHAARATDRSQKLSMGWGFLAAQIALVALILVACAGRIFPWFGAIAFVPILVRGFAWFGAEPRPLAIHSVGKSELVYACIFGLLLIAGMQMT